MENLLRFIARKLRESDEEARHKELSKPLKDPAEKARAERRSVVFASSFAAALAASSPAELPETQFPFEQQDTRPIESAKASAETQDGAYVLVRSLIRNLAADPAAAEAFEQLFPRHERSETEYMRAITEELGLYNPMTRESIVLQPGDYLSFDRHSSSERRGLSLLGEQGPVLELVDAEGRKHPYDGGLAQF